MYVIRTALVMLLLLLLPVQGAVGIWFVIAL